MKRLIFKTTHPDQSYINNKKIKISHDYINQNAENLTNKDSILFPNKEVVVSNDFFISNNGATDQENHTENNSIQQVENQLVIQQSDSKNDHPQIYTCQNNNAKENEAIGKITAAYRGYKTRELENKDDKGLDFHPMRRRIINNQGKIENKIVGYRSKSNEIPVILGNPPPSINSNIKGMHKSLTHSDKNFVGLTSHHTYPTQYCIDNNEAIKCIHQVIIKEKLTTIIPQHLVKTNRIESNKTTAYFVATRIGQTLKYISYETISINILSFKQLTHDLSELHKKDMYHGDLHAGNLFLGKANQEENIIYTTDIGNRCDGIDFITKDKRDLLSEIMLRTYKSKRENDSMKRNFINTYIKSEYKEVVTNYFFCGSNNLPDLYESIDWERARQISTMHNNTESETK